MLATSSHTTLLQVPVLIGAPEELVKRRQLRNKYCTNQDIKTWSAWFLLKSLSSSSFIKGWIRQSLYLEHVLQCNEGTLKALINRLKNLQLLNISNGNISLCSYHKAADILQIPYNGKTTINYDYEKQKGNQAFAYLLRVSEIENAKEFQLGGLLRHVNKNPELEQVLMQAMECQGYETETVTGEEFQQWLYKMQCRTFAEGSAIYDEIHARRADINRSVKGIQDAHTYKCKTSVSYMKKILKKYNLATIKKTIVESAVRCRKYIFEGAEKLAAYKYNKARKSTLLVMCDDISPIQLPTP